MIVIQISEIQVPVLHVIAEIPTLIISSYDSHFRYLGDVSLVETGKYRYCSARPAAAIFSYHPLTIIAVAPPRAADRRPSLRPFSIR
eukprot:6209184-Pleurochrysis_carterae.AAC.2